MCRIFPCGKIPEWENPPPPPVVQGRARKQIAHCQTVMQLGDDPDLGVVRSVAGVDGMGLWRSA